MDSQTVGENHDTGFEGGFRIRKRWVKIWLACMACWFLFWWVAAFLIFAGPALAGWFVRGTSLEILRINLWLPVAISKFPNLPTRGAGFFALHGAFIIVGLTLVITTLIARRASGTRRVLAGLALSVTAGVGMLASVTRFGWPRVTIGSAFAMLIFFAVMLLGFRWMLRGWCPPRYWARVASLVAAFDLPLAILLGMVAIFGRQTFGPFRWTAFFLLPGIAAALLAAALPVQSEADTSPIRWRPVVNGVVLSALLVAGVAVVGSFLTRAFAQIRVSDNREALAELPKIATDAPYPKLFFQKGVSFSSEWPDPYESRGAREMLLRLKNYGVNAIALVPYASMREGSPQVRGFGPNSMESDEGLREMSRLAHALGMKVMLKPGVWVRGGKFAGDLDFPQAAERRKFFADYGEFIDRYARLATEIHADLFCVGGEFVKLTLYQDQWRALIARVRKLYPGPLTYAANYGTEFETVRFWDALDYIGLQNYYPLPADLSTADEVAKVEAVQERYNKPVIFTEVGFPSAPGANQHPWEDGKGGRADLKLQSECYRAIFQAFYSKPWFQGMYWWKIGTNGFGGAEDTSLTPWGKPAMEVVKQWYEGAER